MNQLTRLLSDFVVVVPNPPPIAPPDVGAKVDRLIGFAKFLSIAALSLAIVSSGVLVLAGSGFGQDRISQKMQERVGWSCVAAVVVSVGTGIIGWFL